MATYSFKSVGTTQQDQLAQTQALTQTPVPVGIITPLRPGTMDVWATSTSLADQIADNLRNLILTNWGERVAQYNFGANLKEITTDIVSQDDFDSKAISRIRAAVQLWMPYVNLETFESVIQHVDNLSTGIIRLNVTYNVPALGTPIQNRTLEVTLYII